MADEEREPRFFTLKEAERARVELEPLLVEAMESRRKVAELDQKLAEIAGRIMMMGGVVVSYERAARLRAERDKTAAVVAAAVEKIHSTGCLVKDLEMGLLDFPALLNNQEVLLCWRLGEDRIRFYHGTDEGYAGRKPLDPRDPGTAVQ
jgi:hypothetical protein